MNKTLCVVSCPADTFSGYGSRSRDILKSLFKLKGGEWDIKIASQRWGITPYGALNPNDPEDKQILDNFLENPQLPKQPEIWVQITVPNEFNPIGKYNIGITAGIETTICDPSWIEGCNKMNEIWVSSVHSKEVFEQSKFEKRDKNTNQVVGNIEIQRPVKVLFEGARLETYKPITSSEIKSINLDEIKESFCFLYMGHWLQGDLGQDRKNTGMLIKVFLETFKNKGKQPALILKTSMATSSIMDKEEILKRIDAIRKTVKGKLPNIYLVHGNLSDTEVNELYNHSKVKAMVNLTKGEGFGRPLLEFSLTKKPVITTGWSGHTDFLNPEFSILLPGRLEPLHDSAVQANVLLKESQWFTVDYVAAGNALVDVFNNYKKWDEKANRQAYHSRTNFSFEKMTELISEYIDAFESTIPKAVELQLPKLQLPKLKKVGENNTPELPKLKLPKLKKVEA
jgi:glycosyltransferase involved in cell wall biosynthesis